MHFGHINNAANNLLPWQNHKKMFPNARIFLCLLPYINIEFDVKYSKFDWFILFVTIK